MALKPAAAAAPQAPQAKPVSAPPPPAAKPVEAAAPVAEEFKPIQFQPFKLDTAVGPGKTASQKDVATVQDALAFYFQTDKIPQDGKITKDAKDITVQAIKQAQTDGIKQFNDNKAAPKPLPAGTPAGIDPKVFKNGEPDGVISPKGATINWINDNNRMAIADYNEKGAAAAAAAKNAPPAQDPGAAAPKNGATAPVATAKTPVEADYEHGFGHTVESTRSGEAFYEGIGVGNQDNGRPNVGVWSGLKQIVAGNTEDKVDGHGTFANIAIGTGEVISGSIRTVASAPYLALEAVSEGLKQLKDNTDAPVSWLFSAAYGIVAVFKFVAEIFSFLGGLLSSLFLWDSHDGKADILQRWSDSTDDLSFVENDAARQRRLEREQISRDVAESTRTGATMSTEDKKKLTDDMAAHDATIKALGDSIKTLTAQVAAEKDANTKKALQSALDSLTKNLKTEQDASAADKKKLDGANTPANADAQRKLVLTSIDELNGRINEDDALSKSTQVDGKGKLVVSGDQRTAATTELNELKVILASQNKLLAGLPPPAAAKPAATAPAASTTAKPAAGATTTTDAPPQAKPVAAAAPAPKGVVTEPSDDEIQIN